MIFETSWDDGSPLDIHLVDMLKRYQLPATFYIHADKKLSWVMVREIAKEFKIGSHTVTHPENLRFLEEDFLFWEIQTSKDILETALEGVQNVVDSFAYPGGKFNDYVAAKVKEAGYVEARTVEVLRTDTKWKSPFHKPTTIHCYDGRKEYQGKPWDEVAEIYFKKALKENGYFHIWGHADEIHKNQDWLRVENFFRWIHRNYKHEIK